eukprot:934246-Ditylum_brightwellii.AAC.1
MLSSAQDRGCENQDCKPQESTGKLPSKKALKEHPESSWDMGKLGTSFADELLPVSGLTVGNKPRDKHLETTMNKGAQPKFEETKTGENKEKTIPILYCVKDTNSDSEKGLITMEDKLKINGNKAIDKQKIVITPVKNEFVVPTTMKIFPLCNNVQNLLNIVKMADNNLEVQSTKDEAKWKYWEHLPQGKQFENAFCATYLAPAREMGRA